MPFIRLTRFPSIVNLLSFLSWMDIEFLQMLFLYLLKWLYLFFYSLLICQITLTFEWWTILSFLGKSHTVITCSFYTLLDSMCKSYVEHFFIYVHEGYWSIVLFSWTVPVFGIKWVGSGLTLVVLRNHCSKS